MKRFYEEVSCGLEGNKWEIRLDGRPMKTPMKADFAVSNKGLAVAIAAEWQAQEGDILPETMPLTRMANTVIDRVGIGRAEMMVQLMDYAPHDLLLYRADEPVSLYEWQGEVWQPILDWLFEAHGIKIVATRGIMPVAQEATDLQKMADLVEKLDNWHFAVLQNLAALTGSLVIAVAFLWRYLTPDKAFAAASIDENHQAIQWGKDARVARLQEEMFAELQAMHVFLELL